jgi:hypothetical protein
MRESPEPRSPAPEAPRPPNRTGKPAQPLYLRLYFHKHLIDLVRLVGYDGLPLESFRERLQPLVDTHGEDTIRDACAEILHVDEVGAPPCARLTEHVRALAVGILGRPDRAQPPPMAAPTANTASTDAPSGSPVIQVTGSPAESPPEPRRHDRTKGTTAAEKAPAASKPAPDGAKPKVSKTSKRPPATKPAPKKRH